MLSHKGTRREQQEKGASLQQRTIRFHLLHTQARKGLGHRPTKQLNLTAFLRSAHIYPTTLFPRRELMITFSPKILKVFFNNFFNLMKGAFPDYKSTYMQVIKLLAKHW